MEERLQQAIEEAIEIAKTGTTEEKEDFVTWACTAINWFSSQFNEEGKLGLKVVEAQYKAYLNALNNQLKLRRDTLIRQELKKDLS